jgi:NitT/TauT family transport system substrate-binding protein
MMTRRFALASGLAMTLLAAPLGAQETRAITFVQPNPSAISSFPVFVAIGEGFFAEEGLDVTAETVDGSGLAVQAVAAGQAQFARPGPGVVMNARARGEDVVFIYNVAARSNFGIVVPGDSPAQGPGDLRGEVVGVATSDGAEVSFARNVLAGSGLIEGEDFTFLAVGDGGPAATGFDRGDIAAYAASLADAAILNLRGLAVRDITPAEYRRFFGNGLVTTGALIREDPDLVERFIRGFARGHAFAMEPANRERALAHLAEASPQESEDPAFANALFDTLLANATPLEGSQGLGWVPPDVWGAWHEVLVETGALETPLEDVQAGLNNDFVLSVQDALER